MSKDIVKETDAAVSKNKGGYGRGSDNRSKFKKRNGDGEMITNGKRDNDAAWYAKDPQLLKDAASLPFSQMAGTTLPFPEDTAYDSVRTLPGVMTIWLEPSLGCGVTNVDAPTVAARNIYTFIRHANSGSANYEAQDLMMMIVAHGGAQAWIEELRRVYGLLRLYSVKNRYYGRSLVESLGFDYDSLATQMADFRAYINLVSLKLDTIKIPAGLSFIDRWKWCSSSLYVDGDTTKAQLYAYKFAHYPKYSGFTSSTGTELQWMAPQSSPVFRMDLNEIKSFTDGLISPLYFDEDVGIMSGDIMKAYGDSVSTIGVIGEDYKCLPDYNTEVLMQIHNLKFLMPTVPTSFTGTLSHFTTQSGDIIKDQIYSTWDMPSQSAVLEESGFYKIQTGPFLLDMYTETPTPDQSMVASRLIPVVKIAKVGSGDQYANHVVACGTEVPLFATIKFNASVPSNTSDSVVTFGYFPSARAIALISAFDWHPRVYIPGDFEDKSQAPVGVLGDLENYTLLENSTLLTIHRVAVLSEFAWTTKAPIK